MILILQFGPSNCQPKLCIISARLLVWKNW
jgi:hypothetical protein